MFELCPFSNQNYSFCELITSRACGNYYKRYRIMGSHKNSSVLKQHCLISHNRGSQYIQMIVHDATETSAPVLYKKCTFSVVNSLIDGVYQVKLALSGSFTKRSATAASSEKAVRRDAYVPSIHSHFALSLRCQTPQWTQLRLRLAALAFT